jgi:signal transduction histidine kinase
LRGYAADAVDYIFKPVDPDLLRARVAVFVELHMNSRRLLEQAELLAWHTAELERSNADLEQFAYIASHDLQEPLRAISGYLELLADDLASGSVGDEAQQWIDRTRGSAARMATLVGDLLVYARAGAGAVTREAVDLDDVLGQVRHDLGALLDETGARIEAERLGRVLGSPVELRRVLQNVLTNAVRYGGDGTPVVRIHSEQRPGEVEVCVADNGVGVAEADLERVFGMFERVAGQPYPGTGLGLAVCRRLVERGGGHIWMEPNRGAGVSVHIVLPAVPA